MKKTHVAVIALLLAVAAVFGTVAATRTAHLGNASRRAADAAYVARVKQLDAYARSLQRQLAARPKATAGTRTAVAPRVVYHRPPPIVVVKHTHHGDDGGSENADGGDGGGDG